jgi:hypothetical protein
MADLDAIPASIDPIYPMEVSVESDVAMTVRMEFTGRDRSRWPQEVSVQVDERPDGSWVVVAAAVCGRALLDPDRALRHSAGLGVGALVIAGDTYLLQAALPAEGLAPERLRRVAWLIGHEAARLRMVGRGADRPPDEAHFAMFAA